MTSDPLALPDRSLVNEKLGDWAKVHSDLAGLLLGGIPSADALAKWGCRLLRQKRSGDAIAALRCAAAIHPDRPPIWTNLGIAFDQEGDSSASAKCFERSLGLFPQQPETWLLLGIVRRKQRSFSAAEAACHTAISTGVEPALAWRCLAVIKQEQRDYCGAIEFFLKCQTSRADDASIHASLGRLYYQTGQVTQACQSYSEAARLDAANLHYRRMLCRVGFIRDVLNGRPIDEAIESLRVTGRDGWENPSDVLEKTLQAAFGFLSGFGHVEAATRVGELVEKLRPSAAIRYLMRALRGDQALLRAPPEFIVDQFDRFAQGFDAQLVGELQYELPEKICAALRWALGEPLQLDVLDVGCGTGLCGAGLRGIARKLTGVDLSPRMLERAGQAGLYDELVCADLVQFLERSEECFDAIVAADVLIYFGDLATFASAAARALRRGGTLVFSTEFLPERGFRIQRSGRFAHAPEYVRSVAASSLTELRCLETTIRLEANQRVAGNVFLYRRAS